MIAHLHEKPYRAIKRERQLNLDQLEALELESQWVPSAIRELERHEKPFRPHPEQDQWVHDRELASAYSKMLLMSR